MASIHNATSNLINLLATRHCLGLGFGLGLGLGLAFGLFLKLFGLSPA